ncbi:hypothetical protein GCM10007989_07830 [Devosia pacifica]|uniref:Uncharacterized protein n=1 Tax=Devosia pacifica TaxID=1335967 RepID=A0A918RY19_9HYPH|nr:hypothetical protein [Devosia pacifica]GHA15490.1 hypothetical protein GCM10007989_07830 [Devosia pacifica]
MARIAKDTTLVITVGCYSDYRDHGPFKVLRDFDQHEVAKEYTDNWAKEHPDSKDWDGPDLYGFMGWLAKNDYIEDIEGTQVWHLGDYYLEPETWPDAEPQP